MEINVISVFLDIPDYNSYLRFIFATSLVAYFSVQHLFANKLAQFQQNGRH